VVGLEGAATRLTAFATAAVSSAVALVGFAGAALEGGEVIGSGSQPDITLEVGKGGKGASIVVSTEQCNSGFIEFVAKFSGVDAENDICVGTRTLRKACR
jgi:hypothetical protein